MNFIKWLKDTAKDNAIATGALVAVFGLVPWLITKLDPSSKVLDFSILNLLLLGLAIIALGVGATWAVINTVFSETVDEHTDNKEGKPSIRADWKAVKPETRLWLTFATLWVVFVTSVYAIKPILFIVNN